MLPQTSIIVPIRNRSGKMDNISNWLNKIDDPTTEIIFVEDNSTDNTLNELGSITSNFPQLNIRLISGAFHGPGGARNAGMASARGEWITFWDADDSPNPDSFMKMISLAEAGKYDFAVGHWKRYDTSNRLHTSKGFDDYGTSFREIVSNPGIWRWAFKRTGVGSNRFPQLLLGEDLVFLSELPIKYFKIYRYGETVYTYVSGDDSQLTSNTSINANSKSQRKFLISREFLIRRVTFFGLIIKLKLIFSSIWRVIK